MALLGLVVLVQAAYLSVFTGPPHSSHDGFSLVPQLQKLIMGSMPDDPSFGMFEGTWFPPAPDPDATSGWAPWLERVRGNVRSHTWIDAPHPLALAGAAAALLPGHLWVPAAVVTGYFLILLISLYVIGSRISCQRVGLLCAVLAAGSPALFGMSRYVETQLPVVAVATCLVALLLSLDRLGRWWMCLATSLLAWSLTRSGEGAGELVIAGLTVVGPGVWVLVRSGRGAQPTRWLLGVLCLVVPFLLLVDLPFLRASMEKVTRAFADPLVQADVAAQGGALSSPWMWRLAYLGLIGTDYLSPALSVWLLPAAVGLWSIKKDQPLPIWLWLLVPLCALSLMQRKAAWYGFGLVPPLTLLMAIGLVACRRRWVVRGAAATALMQLVLYSGLPASAFVGPLGWVRSPVPVSDSRLRRVDLLRPTDTPERARLRRDTVDFVDWLNKKHPPGGERIWIAAVSQGYGPDYAFRYWVGLQRPDVEVLNLSDPRARKLNYRGFTPNDFVALVYLSDGLAPWPPEMKDRAWFAHNLRCSEADPLDPFLNAVMSRLPVLVKSGKPIYLLNGVVDPQALGRDRTWDATQQDAVTWSLCGP